MITFVTGGARSGKSSYALELADSFSSKVFVATAQAFDEEMTYRIAKHQEERDDSYFTIESPINLAGGIKSAPPETDVILVDCLTVWVGNLMHKHEDRGEKDYPELTDFLKVLQNPPCEMIIVSNEVGMSVVPENPMARKFRDIAGRLNQETAGIADRAFLCVSGIPVTLK